MNKKSKHLTYFMIFSLIFMIYMTFLELFMLFSANYDNKNCNNTNVFFKCEKSANLRKHAWQIRSIYLMVHKKFGGIW